MIINGVIKELNDSVQYILSFRIGGKTQTEIIETGDEISLNDLFDSIRLRFNRDVKLVLDGMEYMIGNLYAYPI